MKRSHVFAVFVLLLAMPFVFGAGSAYSAQWANGQFYLYAYASPLALLPMAGFIGFLFLYRQLAIATDEGAEAVGLMRRFGAFLLDYFLLLLCISPLTALLFLLVEAGHNGHFLWEMSRDYSRNTDGILITFSMVMTFWLLLYYFYKHLLLQRPTIGQYISGYRIVSLKGKMSRHQAALMVFCSFILLCAWPITLLLALFKKERAYWHERVADVSAERFRYATTNTGDEQG